MFILWVTLAGLGFAALVAGGAWALAERGVTTRRTGAEIGAELQAEKMERDARIAGRTPLTSRTAFVGKGWAIERTATFSSEEIVRRFRSGELRPLVPGLIGFGGMVALLLFGSFALLTRPGYYRLGGAVLLLFLVYGLYQFVSGLREAARGNSIGP